MTQKFWVYVVLAPDKQDEYTIALLPFRFRKRPATMKAFAFVSRRTFRSQKRAKQKAKWLFGALDWKPAGTQQKAIVALHRKSGEI